MAKMNIDNILFGPMSKNWCNYFYAFTIFFFCSFILCLFYLIYILVSKSNRNPVMIVFAVEFLIASFIFYIEKRILHSMCVNSN